MCMKWHKKTFYFFLLLATPTPKESVWSCTSTLLSAYNTGELYGSKNLASPSLQFWHLSLSTKIITQSVLTVLAGKPNNTDHSSHFFLIKKDQAFHNEQNCMHEYNSWKPKRPGFRVQYKRQKRKMRFCETLFIFNKVYLFILFHLYTVDRNLKKKKVAVHVCDLKSWL